MVYSHISSNLKEVEERISNACNRSLRKREDITLIAVSKTKTADVISEVYHHNILEFGENKVQELIQKEELLSKDIHWHMIGHLQKNKVKYIANFVSCIHSIDSIELAQLVDKEGKKCNRVIDILVQINVANEDSKYGIDINNTEGFLRNISNLRNINVKGFMTIAPFVSNPEENRMIFRKLSELLVDINNKNIDNINMSVLSMGMSNDYEVAIEEGATHIRVGTNIFGERNYNF